MYNENILKDITIVNKWFNKENKQNEYKISHVKGFWSSNDGITISNTILIKNDGVKVIIFMDQKGYVSPEEYQKKYLKGSWTLKNDDYLIKGYVDEISTIANYKSLYECMKITNVAIKDYGSLDMQHYEIIGE